MFGYENYCTVILEAQRLRCTPVLTAAADVPLLANWACMKPEAPLRL